MNTVPRVDTAIRVYWWQGGLHIEPLTPDGKKLLETLSRLVELVRVEQEVHASPVIAIQALDEQAVVGVHERLKGTIENHGTKA